MFSLFQPLNIVESPRLRKIFLILRKELKNSDIPGRTAIRNRVEKAFEDYLEELRTEMKERCYLSLNTFY